MREEARSKASDILPVTRTKKEAQRFYDRVSGVYDYLSGPFERRYAAMALERLSVREGEIALEVGFGSGHCLKRMAQSVGATGIACGLDISAGMLGVTRRRLDKAGLMNRVELCRGDAASLPYRDSTFDAVFMSYSLELFDTPEIPELLEEVRRVLKPGARLAVSSLSKGSGASTMLKLYEWAHRKWPRYIDCRPIYAEQSLRDAGYEITWRQMEKLFGLPQEIVVAVKAS
ncbi:MAG: methyltransferase domain-containing protein [Dehalococcoidia bacterium]